jgi:hypothetical protein
MVSKYAFHKCNLYRYYNTGISNPVPRHLAPSGFVAKAVVDTVGAYHLLTIAHLFLAASQQF